MIQYNTIFFSVGQVANMGLHAAVHIQDIDVMTAFYAKVVSYFQNLFNQE